MLKDVEEFRNSIGLNVDNMKQRKCVLCGEEFSDKNTHTDAGWKETKISGMCEDCFDDVLSEE